MSRLQLSKFLEQFLEVQQLPGFSVVFKPYPRSRIHRAKRGNTLVDVTGVAETRVVQGFRTVADLFERMKKLAPETAEWIDNKEHLPRLFDDVGEPVKEHEVLKDLRLLPAQRANDSKKKARDIFVKAVHACEQLLEAEEVNQLLADILRKREAEHS